MGLTIGYYSWDSLYKTGHSRAQHQDLVRILYRGRMQKHFLLLGLLASLGCAYCTITEWPLTLHHDIKTNEVGGGSANGLPVVDPPYHCAGYMPLNHSYSAKLFYFYFEERSKNPDAPLLLWTNGGPGCSSLFGLFMENGPYVIQKDYTLQWREYGWDVGQNVIFIDQPVGTGYSEGDTRDYARWESNVGKDMLTFFLEFMDLHPELRTKDIYLSGESYAGHYLPAIADAIVDANAAGHCDLNLKGLIMGSPWTSPVPLVSSYPEFAEFHGLITKAMANNLRKYVPQCKKAGKQCDDTRVVSYCMDAVQACESTLFRGVVKAVPQFNVYDIRKKCKGSLCYDTTLLTNYLNSATIRVQLGVHKGWTQCDPKVYKIMRPDMYTDMGPTVVKLLNLNIRIMIYIGDQDFICNWMGNKAWIDSMKWNKSCLWRGIFRDWKIKTKDGQVKSVGECETVEPLTFCKVYQSGHMMPMDQPETGLKLVHNFIDKKPFDGAHPSLSNLKPAPAFTYHTPVTAFN